MTIADGFIHNALFVQKREDSGQRCYLGSEFLVLGKPIPVRSFISHVSSEHQQLATSTYPFNILCRRGTCRNQARLNL